MPKRIGKQLIYGALYLVVLAALIVGIYFLFVRPAPSCTNGIKDRGEAGVDCGGICANFCLPADLKPIELVGKQVIIFHPTGAKISLLAQIRNANQAWAARNFVYKFTLYDPDNKVVVTQTGNSFIYGAEIKYLTAFLDQDVAEAGRAELEISDIAWAPAATFGKPSLSFQDHAIETGLTGLRITGKVKNNDEVPFYSPEVVIVLYGSAGQPLGVSKTGMGEINASEVESFTVFHPALPGVVPQRTEYYVYAARP